MADLYKHNQQSQLICWAPHSSLVVHEIQKIYQEHNSIPKQQLIKYLTQIRQTVYMGRNPLNQKAVKRSFMQPKPTWSFGSCTKVISTLQKPPWNEAIYNTGRRICIVAYFICPNIVVSVNQQNM